MNIHTGQKACVGVLGDKILESTLMCELNEDDILKVVSAITRNVLDDGNSVDGDTAPNLLRDNWPESRSLRTTRAVTHARLERRRKRSQNCTQGHAGKILHELGRGRFGPAHRPPRRQVCVHLDQVCHHPYSPLLSLLAGHDKPTIFLTKRVSNPKTQGLLSDTFPSNNFNYFPDRIFSERVILP